MFNGVRVKTTVDAAWGDRAAVERAIQESYELDLTVRIRVPKPSTALHELANVNPHLPTLLPGLEAMLLSATADPFFDDLYKRKVATIHKDLVRLDQLISRHNFFDCETILRLEHPTTKRRALIIQADMDVVMDGSDGDRVPITDGSSMHFQPTTSFRWRKRGPHPNPFLAIRQERLATALAELATATGPRAKELRDAIPRLRAEVKDLETFSFLVSATDPFVVVPGPLFAKKGPFSPKLGDYCVVVFGNQLYPAIVGDIGPSYKAGEASLRIAKELNAKANAMYRPVSDLTVTYLVFPDSADAIPGPPNLDRFYDRCTELLNNIGGFQGRLHRWTDITTPPPTPTPTPSPIPSPPTESIAMPTPVPTPTPIAIPNPLATPAPAPGGLVPIKPTLRPSLSPKPGD